LIYGYLAVMLISMNRSSTAAIEPPRLNQRAPGNEAAPGNADFAALKRRDNLTNWLYLGGVWAIIAATILSALALEAYIASEGLHWGWTVLVVATAALITGASQHNLGGAVHEGTHGLLFNNKILNELASDWLAAFPIYTSTYQYRVQHFAHHQFVNDPVRDPDISQLKDSNHWLDFPIVQWDILRALLRQLWLPNLMLYTLVRARYSSVGHEGNPYLSETQRRHGWPTKIGLGFAIGSAFLVNFVLVSTTSVWAAHATIIGAYVATIAYFAFLPEEKFPQSRLQPVISHRATMIGRMTFLFVIYWGLTALDAGTGTLTHWNTFGRYWVIPLFTTFPLYMMMRQWVQHGNADRGRFTNTRVFFFGPMLRYAVFPWGMDYHLPHHVMAAVPHYNLKALHTALVARDPEYAAKGIEIEGIWHAPHMHDDQAPSVAKRPLRQSLMYALSLRHEGPSTERAHVDNTTLEGTVIADRAAIDQIAAASAAAREEVRRTG